MKMSHPVTGHIKRRALTSLSLELDDHLPPFRMDGHLFSSFLVWVTRKVTLLNLTWMLIRSCSIQLVGY
ncbi:hypothetical protein NC652_037485 [Populus alba x Populus x berolinensis]|nr:hypothetical protein NC651_036291 [Populus alba x Populus x berolinensis]KAJ6865971.1 hypothetical protein NC652_037485 [Populus alba x Populus x berolinensis]